MNVMGVGGVFWRSRNINELKKWYSEVLGIALNNEWNGTTLPSQEGNETIFSLFKEDNDYFPKEQQVMLNFQVEDMNECLKHLKNLEFLYLKKLRRVSLGHLLGLQIPKEDG